jgi:uncharacterized RDD family membrane protein YckC
MANLRRIVLVGLWLSGLILFCQHGSGATSTPALATGPLPTELAQANWLRGPGSMPPLKMRRAPLLVAGDEGTLWVVRTVTVDGPPEASGFQLLAHETGRKTNNRDAWTLAQLRGQAPVILGDPAAVSVLPAEKSGTHAPAYILFDNGQMYAYSLTDRLGFDNLPSGQKPVAAAGFSDGVYVLTLAPTAAPATTAAAAPNSASQPTATSAPGAAQVWSLYRYSAGRWTGLALGAAGEHGWPVADAAPVLLLQTGIVALAWPGPDQTLKLRWTGTLDERPSAPSHTFTLPVKELIPRLQAVTIGPESFLLWTGRGPTDGLEIHGVALRNLERLQTPTTTRPAQAPDVRWLSPLDLGTLATGIEPGRDVAVGRTGGSLIGVVATREGDLKSLLFDTTGKLLEGPSLIEPQEEAEPIFGQNIIFILLIALLALSLWQWRRRPMQLRLPQTLKPAYLRQRVLAGAIDLALPVFAVVLFRHLYRDQQWISLGKQWFDALWDQELWGRSPELLWILAGYTAHVTITELLTGRSLGKTVLGIKVVAIDGERPRPLPILLRNAMRAIEVSTGLLLIYVLLNDQRQRLGDLLARTIVVREAAPDEEPET